MASNSPQIHIAGLKEFRKELRAMDRKWPKELRKVNKAIADKVAEGTRQSMQSRPGVAPKVAASVKALAQQTKAQVRIGGDRWPYALGSEFGSNNFKQFPPARKGGYSLYPTIAAMRDEIPVLVQRGVEDIARQAFPS